jgi:hypothetical protein
MAQEDRSKADAASEVRSRTLGASCVPEHHLPSVPARRLASRAMRESAAGVYENELSGGEALIRSVHSGA